jgi:hypothetical protein
LIPLPQGQGSFLPIFMVGSFLCFPAVGTVKGAMSCSLEPFFCQCILLAEKFNWKQHPGAILSRKRAVLDQLINGG